MNYENHRCKTIKIMLVHIRRCFRVLALCTLPDTGTEYMHYFYCHYQCTASSWWTPHMSRHPWVVLDQPRPKLKVWSHSEQNSRFLLYVIQHFFLTSSACHCATKFKVVVALKLEEFLSILLRVNNIVKKTKTNKLVHLKVLSYCLTWSAVPLRQPIKVVCTQYTDRNK